MRANTPFFGATIIASSTINESNVAISLGCLNFKCVRRLVVVLYSISSHNMHPEKDRDVHMWEEVGRVFTPI